MFGRALCKLMKDVLWHCPRVIGSLSGKRELNWICVVVADKIWFSELCALKEHISDHYVQILGRLLAGMHFSPWFSDSFLLKLVLWPLVLGFWTLDNLWLPNYNYRFTTRRSSACCEWNWIIARPVIRSEFSFLVLVQRC